MKESRRDGAHLWVRNNILGLVAIFIALSGTAVATNVASNRSADKPQAQAAKQQVQAAKKKKRRRVGPTGPQGPQGPQGPVGPSTGSAGGDLVGSYPNPTLKPPEAFRVVQSPGNPTFGTCITMTLNKWGQIGGVFPFASFSRDPLGTVRLTGSVTCSGGSPTGGTVIFTLPPGYQPSGLIQFITAEGGGAVGNLAEINIDASGNVIFSAGSDTPGAGDSVSLDGVDFRCSPSGSNGCP